MLAAVGFLARRHLAAAVLLALCASAVSGLYGARVGSSADSYGYVSQADLWLKGDLHIAQDFGAELPWPDARLTLTPLGYRPVRDGWSIVPQYSPGLPLLMAAAKAVMGQCGMFAIVPICTGLLVFTTYVIGRQLDRPVAGLAAAWLVATSPTVIYMMMWPMSDIPAAAFWALAVALSLRDTRASAGAAGCSAAWAILIRPNLVPLAGVLAVWMIWQDLSTARWRAPAQARTPWFIVFASTGAIFIAILNARLYGSPLESGYPAFSDLYAWSFMSGNLTRYLSWVASTQTPLALAGLAALGLPAAALWRTPAARRAHWLLAALAASVWFSYLVYIQFDVWWFLRFLLPSWPMMALGIAALLAMLFHLRRAWAPWVAVAILGGVGAHGIVRASHEQAFTFLEGESKYATVARVVRSLTPPDAVIFTELQSGTIRYYGGRLTVRWNRMDDQWLDRAVEWLDAHGHHPYFLVQDDEDQYLKEKYGPTNVVARLEWSPLVTFRNGTVRLYDAVHRDFKGPPMDAPAPARFGQCWTPEPLPRFHAVTFPVTPSR